MKHIALTTSAILLTLFAHVIPEILCGKVKTTNIVTGKQKVLTDEIKAKCIDYLTLFDY